MVPRTPPRKAPRAKISRQLSAGLFEGCHRVRVEQGVAAAQSARVKASPIIQVFASSSCSITL